jgi:hypothetical protein
MLLNSSWIRLACAAALAGCAAELGGEAIGSSSDALVSANDLSHNAVNLNAINLNAINLNAINLNAISPENLAAIQDPSPTGDLARQLVRYAVSCALQGDQSFDFSWTDEDDVVHHESYPGLLGVAPSWATGPLNDAGQRMVSGCLAARVNYYGVSVMISSRSLQDPLKTLTGSQELSDFPAVEGAFWGNLFGAQPYMNACYNAATVDNSRAWQRDCAVGHLISGGQTVECGIIHIVGPCADVCQKLNGAGQYYPSCVQHPGQSSTTTKLVITTALP